MSERRLVFDFNFAPAGYAHPTWVHADQSMQDRIAAMRSPAARQRLSAWLLKRYQLGSWLEFDFTTPTKALWLRPPAVLQRMAGQLGVLLARDDLRRRIGDGTAARLGAAFGTHAVEQALARWPDPNFEVPMQWTGLAALSSAKGFQLEERLQVSGLRLLLALLDPTWHAVGLRAALKFPRRISKAAAAQAHSLAAGPRVLGQRYLEARFAATSGEA